MANYATAPVHCQPRQEVLEVWSAFLMHRVFNSNNRSLFKSLEHSFYCAPNIQSYQHAFRGLASPLTHWWSMLELGTLWHVQGPRSAIDLEGSDTSWKPNIHHDTWLQSPHRKKHSWLARAMSNFAIRQELHDHGLKPVSRSENWLEGWLDVADGFSAWYAHKPSDVPDLTPLEKTWIYACDRSASLNAVSDALGACRQEVGDALWVHAIAHQNSSTLQAMMELQIPRPDNKKTLMDALNAHPWFESIAQEPNVHTWAMNLVANVIVTSPTTSTEELQP